MKNAWILIGILGFAASSPAVTRSAFPPPYRNAVIMLAAQSIDGSHDDDGARLFQLLVAPVQNSPIMGPGKAIFTESRDLTISCGERPNVGTECSLIFQVSNDVELNPAQKGLHMHLTGDSAQKFIPKFATSTDGSLSYDTHDQKLQIRISGDEFDLQFHDPGPL